MLWRLGGDLILDDVGADSVAGEVAPRADDDDDFPDLETLRRHLLLDPPDGISCRLRQPFTSDAALDPVPGQSGSEARANSRAARPSPPSATEVREVTPSRGGTGRSREDSWTSCRSCRATEGYLSQRTGAPRGMLVSVPHARGPAFSYDTPYTRRGRPAWVDTRRTRPPRPPGGRQCYQVKPCRIDAMRRFGGPGDSGRVCAAVMFSSARVAVSHVWSTRPGLRSSDEEESDVDRSPVFV
jgi:hypothetical protein